MLRRHAERLGYQADFTIMDREDATQLLGACVSSVGIDVKSTRFPKAKVLADILSLTANRQCSVEDTLEAQYPYFSHLVDEMTQVESAYRQRKLENHMMDFDDLLCRWLELLKQETDIRERYQDQFQFLLVDEYQDTPARSEGMRPMQVITNDAHEQAMFVAQKALELREEGIELNEMAILYRSHFHAM
jgi:DNA helicase-2/ATP-dependent DNA helicase PcrA